MNIDLNCDLGEGVGADEALMPLVTSANIACGGHAGGGAVMSRAVELARAHGVAIGAHPGFVDRENFGRRELMLPRAELVDLVSRQIDALRSLTPLVHVKPHGGLYTLAARDRETADAIAEAVALADPSLRLIGSSGSELLRAARRWDLPVAAEVFADRRYQADGSLVPRGRPNALIENVEEALAQVLRMIRERVVESVDGVVVPIEAQTLCVHGDGPHALALAKRLREELADAGVEVRAL